MFRRFESLVETYPDAKPATPPRTFFAFLWQSSAGLRPYILLMTLCTAVIGAFEALLFAMLGQLVDWLANVEPALLWATQRQNFLLLIGVLAVSPLVVGLFALLKYQVLFANFPMRLRWNFHRLMLGQSMAFYQDEFAGRIAFFDVDDPARTLSGDRTEFLGRNGSIKTPAAMSLRIA